MMSPISVVAYIITTAYIATTAYITTHNASHWPGTGKKMPR